VITKTINAIYEDGTLKLEEPVDLTARSRVRVRIEIPSSDSGTDPGLESRRGALPAEKRELLERVRTLRDSTPKVGFDIVDALRDMRENG
jgi:predicted DNA-binding antitoxin AbrB/MazE fold protein